MPQSNQLPLAISLGEPAGIGPDLILQLFAQRHANELPAFIVFGDPVFLEQRAKRLNLDIAIKATTPKDVVKCFIHALPVCDLGIKIDDCPGTTQAASAPLVIKSIERAVAEIQNGSCSALVTAPIHKSALYEVGFSYPGHTEFLAALCAENGTTPRPVMMLAHEDLRTIPLTIHIPLHEVPEQITEAAIVETTQIVAHDLSARLGIKKPKIALAGLNPHAGEDGTIGTEDRDIIAPAIAHLQALGVDAVGPMPADTLFFPPHWRNYDAIIAMYHDQALIPIKTIAFDAGVNVTLGLPIIRTSPDHGTALSLAGTGKASPTSLMAAMKMAKEMTQRGTKT